MKRSILAAAMICATLNVAPARVEECPPLKLYASVDLLPGQGGRQPLVPVEIAGVPKKMILDTGAAMTVISGVAADQLHLGKRQARMRGYNVTGSYTETSAVSSLKMGKLNSDHIVFMVDPAFDHLDPNGDIAGLLGADILGNFDVSVDFGTSKLDLLDQHHCDGKVIYWPHTTVAVVPFKDVRSTSIIVKLMLDGKPVKAILDTGAANSTIHIDAAERLFGIKAGSPDAPAAGTLNRSDLPVYSHRFKSLTFEGVEVSNPEITLIPDMLTEKIGTWVPTGSRLAIVSDRFTPDLLLGMNVLRHLHLYIAYKEKKLYMTPAGKPVLSEAKAN